jgi:ankyrin repeat protein
MSPDATNMAEFPGQPYPGPFEHPVRSNAFLPYRSLSSTPPIASNDTNTLSGPGARLNYDADPSGRTTQPQQQFSRALQRDMARPLYNEDPESYRTASAERIPPNPTVYYPGKVSMGTTTPATDFVASQRAIRPGINFGLLHRPSMPILRGGPRVTPIKNAIPPQYVEQLGYNAEFAHYPSISLLREPQMPPMEDAVLSQHVEQLGNKPSLSYHPSMPILRGPQTTQALFSDESITRTKLLCDGCDAEIVGTYYMCEKCPDEDYCLQCLDSAESYHQGHRLISVNAGETVTQEIPPPINSEPECVDQRAWKGKCIGCKEPIISTESFYGCSICSLEYIMCEAGKSAMDRCEKHPDMPLMKRRLIWYGERPDSVVYVDLEPQTEDSILIRALKEGDMNLLRQLVQDQRLLNEINAEKQTALHVAASLDLQAGARLLLIYGARVEARDDSGCTALGQAILAKHDKFVRMMLERGADPNSLELDGTTPLHLACRTGNVDAVDLLLDKVSSVDRPDGAGETALTLSCRLGEFSIAHNLLLQGADSNGNFPDGKQTLLGHMASCNNSEAVKFLLDHGAQVEHRDSLERTALFRAASKGNAAVCRTLIAHGAKINIAMRDREKTALGSAAESGDEETVTALLDHGADIEGTDSRTRTPLFRAVRTTAQNARHPKPRSGLLKNLRLQDDCLACRLLDR